MTSQRMVLSVELEAIVDRLIDTAMSGVDLSPMEQLIIVNELTGLIRLAEVDEAELRTFRIGRAQRQGRKMVEQLATDAMGNMMLGNEKVVRPDFGRGKE